MTADFSSKKYKELKEENKDLELLSERIELIKKMKVSDDIKKELMDLEIEQFKEQTALIHSNVQNGLLIQSEINELLFRFQEYHKYNYNNFFTPKNFIPFYHTTIDLLRFLDIKSYYLRNKTSLSYKLNENVCIKALEEMRNYVDDYDAKKVDTIPYKMMNELEEIRSLVVSSYQCIISDKTALKHCFGLNQEELNKLQLKYKFEEVNEK